MAGISELLLKRENRFKNLPEQLTAGADGR